MIDYPTSIIDHSSHLSYMYLSDELRSGLVGKAEFRGGMGLVGPGSFWGRFECDLGMVSDGLARFLRGVRKV